FRLGPSTVRTAAGIEPGFDDELGQLVGHRRRHDPESFQIEVALILSFRTPPHLLSSTLRQAEA
ncbi:MAG: hypothetical protein LC808_22535, partial [Actinobacteria bacterium]|nr:hypothetical protein [Actinomycetota bacterium]